MHDLRSASRRGACWYERISLQTFCHVTHHAGASLDAPLLSSSGATAGADGDAKAQKRSLIVSMLMLIISIPTLIGA
jgi:hypothetical protein